MMKSANRAVLLAATTALAGLMAPGLAQAQEAAPARGPSAGMLEEVVVTARRREELQQNVPLAVSAVSGAQLERQAVTSVNDLSGKVPNLIIQPGLSAGATTPVFAIRGLSQQDLTVLSDPSVSLYVNEIVVPRPLGANMGFFDIGNVQVLRGAQGTLFGRNTPGGAVVVTPHGADRTFSASIAQTIGNYDTYITDAMVNLPVNDALSVRVAGQHKEKGGYIFDVLRNNKGVNYVKENAARITVDFHPNDAVHNVLSGAYAHALDGGTGNFAIPIGGQAGAIDQLNRDPYHIASGLTQFSHVETWNVEDIATFRMNEHITFKNILGYRHVRYNTLEDADGTAAVDIHIQRVAQQHQFSEEFQIQGDEDWGNWIAGAYYFREHAEEISPTVGNSPAAGAPTTLPASFFSQNFDVLQDPFAGRCRNAAGVTATPVPTLGNPAGCAAGFSLYGRYSRTSANGTNTSTALFAQTSFKLDSLLNGLIGTIGVRQNYDHRDAVILNRFVGPVVGPAAPGACRFMNAVSGDIPYSACQLPLKASFREPTYNLSLDWHVNRDVLLYAATRHGYRTGGFGARATTVAGLNRTFQPEKVDDIELGMKADWRFAGMFLRTNVAAFHAKYRDIQRLLTDNSTAPVTTVTTNAGRARIQGVELESTFRPFEWLEFSGFYAYTDAKFTSFTGPDGIDRTSVPFSRAPKNIASLTGRVYLPLDAAMGKADVGLNWYHQSGYNASDAWDPRFPVASHNAYWIKGYELVNLDASWNRVMGSDVDVSLYVKNLFDQTYLNPYSIIVLNGATGAGINSRTPGEPRTYGVRVRYTFGAR